MHNLRIRDRHRERQRGQSLLEFALVVPILLLIFAGAADLGRIFYTYVAIENAAKEGALYGARYPLCDNASSLCPSPNNVDWRARQETTNVIATGDLTVTTACYDRISGAQQVDLRDCEPGDRYEVTATTAFQLITPLLSDLMGSNFALANTATADVLNLAFDPTPGVGPTKLVLATGSRNAAEIIANCVEPDPGTSAGYYRSPCLNDATGVLYPIKFRSGDTIFYKIFARNNGGTNLTGVTMADSLGWPGSCPTRPTTMAVGGTEYICSYSRVAPTVPGAATTMDYINTFTVDATEILATTDGATVTVEKPPADLQVLKFVSVYRLGNDGDGVPTFGTADTITVNRAVPQLTSVFVWFRITVTNVGGQTATGVAVADTRATLPVNADCPAVPGTLAVGATWTCRYQVTFNAAQTVNNTASATATGVTPDAGDTDTATVTVATCAAAQRSAPNVIGLTKAQAATAWLAAGFTSSLSSWPGNNAAATVTQNQRAFTCLAPTAAMTITRTTTP